MKRVLTATGLLMLAVYLAWNGWWLAHGRVPPSMLVAAMGIPAPTTGGTHSLGALLRGDWRASLRYNAMAVPVALLFVLSVGRLIGAAGRRKPLVLPPV